MDIKRILCPTDFSGASRHAVEQAIALADSYKSRIVALHVMRPMAVAVSGVPASIEDAGEIDRLRQLMNDEFAGATARQIGLDVLVGTGRPAEAILETAAGLPADLIVMGTHGTGGFQHLLLGSVTEKVLRKALCPVLTVPPHAPATSRMPFERLLCAVDFSDASLDAVRFALSLARESAATLTLLHVLEWPWEEPPSPPLAELPAEQALALTEFRRYLESSARKRLESLVSATMPEARCETQLRNGKPYAQILNLAVTMRADLIIIGVRGRRPLELTLFGSTTNQVVRQATCPVLTLR